MAAERMRAPVLWELAPIILPTSAALPIVSAAAVLLPGPITGRFPQKGERNKTRLAVQRGSVCLFGCGTVLQKPASNLHLAKAIPPVSQELRTMERQPEAALPPDTVSIGVPECEILHFLLLFDFFWAQEPQETTAIDLRRQIAILRDQLECATEQLQSPKSPSSITSASSAITTPVRSRSVSPHYFGLHRRPLKPCSKKANNKSQQPRFCTVTSNAMAALHAAILKVGS